MSFSSLIFVSFFLPVFMIVYYFMPGLSRKNWVLLVFSLVFYAFAGLYSLLLLLFMTLLSWLLGRKIGQSLQLAAAGNPDYQEGDDDFQSPLAEQLRIDGRKKARVWLLLALVLLPAALLLFKCSGIWTVPFANAGDATRMSGICTFFSEIGLPLGMSFYTFKLISYVCDIYMMKTAPGDFLHVLLYTLCFHHVTQGPIVRYGDMAAALDDRRCDPADFAAGAERFVIGLAKKTVLADHLGSLAETFLPILGDSAFSVSGAYLGSLCYMLQLYLDFSAYSDMALGLGRMIGFHYPENFDYPYMAVSVRDFWRRWHISLSRFFRDYVYIPLGGSRVGTGRLIRNLLLVWLLTGFWHGSSWNFLLWGLYYFAFILLEDLVRKRKKQPSGEGASAPAGISAGIFRAASHVYALLVVFFGWVLFRFSNFSVLREVLRTMFFASGRVLADASELMTLRSNLFFLVFSIIACTPLGHRLMLRIRALYDAGLAKESYEKQQLLLEQQRYQKENALDRQLQRLDASSESFAAEDAEHHARAVSRLTRRIEKSTEARGAAEGLYFGLRILRILLLLALSVVSMVGASYTPFLYNQF